MNTRAKNHSAKQTPLELLIAWRYFRSRQVKTNAAQKTSRFVSFISMVSLLGIALGVAALIVVTSVMNGFAGETRSRLLNANTHIKITPQESATNSFEFDFSSLQDNEAFAQLKHAPYLSGFGMLAKQNNISAVEMHGINPLAEKKINHLDKYLLIGELAALEASSDHVIIGDTLAFNLGVSIDDEVTIIIPQSDAENFDFTPKLKLMRVVGIFRLPFPEANQNSIYLNIEDLANLQNQELIFGRHIRLANPMDAANVSNLLQSSVAEQAYKITDWTVEQASFFRAIKTERTIMFILLFLIIAVAIFNIISTIMMVVKNKRSDIAILRTLGLGPRSVTIIFFYQGLIIGLLGLVIGIVLGLLLTMNVNPILSFFESVFRFELFPSDMFLINGLPVDIDWQQIAWVSIFSFLLCAIAAIYPAMKAASIEPGEALRYE